MILKAFSGISFQAQAKLDLLENAASLDDLRAIRGNRLEALKGDRLGQYSIRINDQYRVCFEWPEEAKLHFNIEIVDYH
ncbi:MAG: type II toxin-antitoxin system RelE/ParE family toxin [Thermomicrobiales bacterium]